MSQPTIVHCTPAELGTELFWTLHVDPVARQHGLELPTQMQVALPDQNTHLLKHPDDGRVLLIVRTDREDA